MSLCLGAYAEHRQIMLKINSEEYNGSLLKDIRLINQNFDIRYQNKLMEEHKGLIKEKYNHFKDAEGELEEDEIDMDIFKEMMAFKDERVI